VRELLRTNDLVELSLLRALLSGAGIEHMVLDTHMSILEGSANAIPRRLMVLDEDYDAARAALIEAEILDSDGSA
jgi:hypothetical protein